MLCLFYVVQMMRPSQEAERERVIVALALPRSSSLKSKDTWLEKQRKPPILILATTVLHESEEPNTRVRSSP